MACPTPQAIAMSGRLAPSTIAHVLRLVGSSYLEAGPSSRVYRSLPRALSSVTSVRASRRFASSAHALLESRDMSHLDMGHLEQPFVLTPKKNKDYPRERTLPTPKWAFIPQEDVKALFGLPRPRPAAFRERFQAAGGNPAILLPARRLEAVAEIWCSPDTGRADWVWLLNLLNDIKAASPKWDEVPGSESLFRVLRGMAFAISGDWDTARANVAVGIKAALAASPSPDLFPERDLFVIEQYVELCRDENRIEDIGQVVKFAGQQLHKRLSQIPGTQVGGRPQAVRLRHLLQTALNDIRQPMKWLEQQQTVPGRDGGFSRANYHLAVVLLASLVSDKSRVSDAFVFWRGLIQHFNSTSIPPVVASGLAANLAREGNVEAAKQVFASLHEKHASVPHSALSRELWMYATLGEVDEARRLWNRITSRYQPTQRDQMALAMAYAARGDIVGARQMLHNFYGSELEGNVDALAILQRACIAMNDSEGALKYLNLAPNKTPTRQLFEPLLVLYAKQADVDNAVDLFQRMISAGLVPSRDAFTSLISAFANKADYVNAGYVFKAMQDGGIEPDSIAWAALLNASIEAGEWLLAAQQCEAIPTALLRTPELATTVLKAYVLVRAPNSVIMKTFRRMHNPTEQAWALAIMAAADDGNLVLGQSLFDEMDSKSKLDPLSAAPNVYVYSILLGMYLKAGDRDSARSVYDTMLFNNVLPSSVTYGIITTSYSNSPGDSSADQAHSFAMSVYDLVIAAEQRHARGAASENVFGPLLIAAGRSKDLESVRQYYDFIRSTGCNSITLTTKLMEAYRRSGDTKQVYRLWLRLFRNAVRTVPSRNRPLEDGLEQPLVRSQNNILCVPMSITIKAMAEAGLHSRLRKLWQSVRRTGFGFDAANYNHMATALAVTGDVEGAFHIVDRVLIPRFEEVRERYQREMRERETLLPVDADFTPDDIPDAELDAMGDWDVLASAASEESAPGNEPPLTTDDVAEFGPRVSNRRREYLATFSPRGRERREYEEDEDVRPDTDLLRYWRPSDVLWRPTAATLNVLDQAYSQLEDQRAYRAWVGLSVGDETEGDDEYFDPTVEPPAVTLPQFNNTTVKNQDGTPKRMSPKLILLRLNRKYARAVALVSFHRRKRMRAEYQGKSKKAEV